MLNNPFVIEQCDALASKISKAASGHHDQIQLAFRYVYGRDASEHEHKAALEYFRNTKPIVTKDKKGRATTTKEQQSMQSLSQFCQALFCSAEFRFLN
jgi:hypothetical protein